MAAQPQLSAARRLADAVEAERSSFVDLPLRYWCQVAHYVAPGTDGAKVRSAMQGTLKVRRLLAELGLGPADVANRLGLEPVIVEQALSSPDRAPVVVLDGEDGVASPADRQASIVAVVGGAIRDADWGAPAGQGTLRAYRAERLLAAPAQGRLAAFLRSVAHPAGPDAYPLDIVVYPKAELPEEVDVLLEILDDAERSMRIPHGRVKVALIAESAAALIRLDSLVARARSRLCAVVVGSVDYAADVGALVDPDRLRTIDWVRATVVNVAAAHGVPAIDGMTTSYPIRPRGVVTDDDRRTYLDRMALAYHAARDAFDLGMCGKWVGHPVQLFAVLLAWRAALAPSVIEDQVQVLERYGAAFARGDGVIALAGEMIDAASVRSARARLRRAAATGLLDQTRARDLGVIGPDETVHAMERP